MSEQIESAIFSMSENPFELVGLAGVEPAKTCGLNAVCLPSCITGPLVLPEGFEPTKQMVWASDVCLLHHGSVGGTGGIRTRTVLHLKQAPPASWATVPCVVKDQGMQRGRPRVRGAGLSFRLLTIPAGFN